MDKPNSLETMTKSLSHALSVAIHRGLPEGAVRGSSAELQRQLTQLELDSTSDASARELVKVFAEMEAGAFADIHTALLRREPRFPDE
ncbi:MAG: hypothetical protein K0U93_26195 [Gammaproteobacteria bacterium]|nr:hypothetical protein [Gammaproteobacteria bacterium]